MTTSAYLRLLPAGPLLALLSQSLYAQDYTFGGALASNSIWSNNANWTNSPPIGGPDAAGIWVKATRNISSSYNIVLYNTGDAGDAGKTVGKLEFGDTNGSDAYTFV